ncbi:NlpC/P60 family protein [Apilactobacillus ozensis]|uniref:NlpC/P60 family protein n=1 Tax=Apilactobacillus ozensis TaxID=866801 RepID=UPI000704F53B|nr:NlpC/P60 family protein [Apilactobacillus ozensis]
MVKKLSYILVSLTLIELVFIFFSNKVSANSVQNKILQIAKSKIGTPYNYGGNGLDGYDCSGFVKYVYKIAANKDLPRTTEMQYQATNKINDSQLKLGDLIFFGKNGNEHSHIGIYIGNREMIDAQLNGVKQESIDEPWWHISGYSRPLGFQDKHIQFNKNSNKHVFLVKSNRLNAYRNITLRSKINGFLSKGRTFVAKFVKYGSLERLETDRGNFYTANKKLVVRVK